MHRKADKRWILALQEYEFAIIYRPGRNNGNADALSRFPQPLAKQIVDDGTNEEIQVGVAPTYIGSTWTPEDIRSAQKQDPVILQIVEQLNGIKGQVETTDEWKQNGEWKRYRQLWTQLRMSDGILHRCVDERKQGEKMVLVVPRRMRTDLLKLAHDDPSSGHMGQPRTQALYPRAETWEKTLVGAGHVCVLQK